MTDDLKIRLRGIRRQAGLSASEMAHHVGLKDRKSWENYERGNTIPKADVLTRLAQLGIDINWLLTGNSADSQGNAPRAVPQDCTPALNTALLAQIGEEITLLLQTEQQDASPGRIAALQAQAYADLVSTYDTDPERSLGLRLILQQIRQRLRSPLPDA